MWDSPIYKFKTKVNGKTKEIFIDVTGSAPNFSVPGKQLEGSFEVLLKGLDPQNTKILDFGGAKLRNTLYLLKKGFTVYACEFEDLFKRSKQAFDYLEEAKRYKQTFKKLIFPKDFIDFKEKFDVVLLINVLDIMPVPIERLCVLALCRAQIKEGGRLLWYTQHGAYTEEKAVARLYDGLVTGKGRKYNMFYRDFTRKEIHDMLQSTGFSYNKEFKFYMSGSNQAYVFNADGPILIDSLGLIEQLKTKSKITTKKVKRESGLEDKKYETLVPKETTPLKEINILKQYREELKNLKPGQEAEIKYHQLIFNILKDVFVTRLNKPKKETYLANGTQRCDITFQNQRTEGVFKQIAEGYGIICPNIFIECKNYSGDLGNTEIFQIRSRLNKIRGKFGIICCRKIENKRKLKDRLNDAIKKEEYIVILEDEDIIKLINFRLKGQEEKN